MAEFQIMSKDGLSVRASGALVYNGTYLKPGYVEFQEIASPTPIPWKTGDYVDYPRTGLRYKLYITPKSLKQGEQTRYGGSFVYENVQFFDSSKEIELAPFIDLVPYDNLVHFSTLNSVAFVGTPANVAERVQACLEYWYPSSRWRVKVVSSLDPTEDAELIETLATEAEFSISGATCLDVLDKVYETWNGLGWSFSVEGDVNTITIGAPNKRTASNTTDLYSRIGDNGLTAIARSVSNAEEMGTRLYAYGSSRNIPTDYYRSKNIKDAESVDIEHLMIPINPVASLDYDGWGLTDGVPDARLAYIEDEAAVSKYGLIPRYAYFDGSDPSLPEIFPSIEGVTIGDVIDAKAQISDTGYVPSLSRWSRADRIDEVVSAVNPSDNGGSSSNGEKYAESGDYATTGGELDSSEGENPDTLEIGHFSPSSAADIVDVAVNLTGTIRLTDTTDISGVRMVVRVLAGSATATAAQEILISLQNTDTSGVYSFSLEGATTRINLTGMTYVQILVEGYKGEGGDYAAYDYHADINAGSVFLGFNSSLGNTFTATIPQIGFNLLQYADMGNGKTISMKSGMCAGRDFPIKAATYNRGTDTWQLTVGRVKDTDTGLWFPNSDFPIESGDKYVLLDIAMPELYILMGAVRLLKAAKKLLGGISSESPFYEPQIDSKRVYNENRILREGMWMHLGADEIVDGGGDYALIDTLRIDEAVSNIPVYEVTLRKKKPIEWTETISRTSTSVSSTPVEETHQTVAPTTKTLDWFIPESFEEDGETKYRLKLNPKYEGMYAEGWVSAGGVSDQGGGGGGTGYLRDLLDVNASMSPTQGQALVWDDALGKWTAGDVSVDLTPYERIANRVTTVSSSSNHTQYPTAKAVWDAINDMSALGLAVSNSARISSIEDWLKEAEWDRDMDWYLVGASAEYDTTDIVILT